MNRVLHKNFDHMNYVGFTMFDKAEMNEFELFWALLRDRPRPLKVLRIVEAVKVPRLAEWVLGLSDAFPSVEIGLITTYSRTRTTSQTNYLGGKEVALAQKQSPLFKLPREIRDDIYGLLLVTKDVYLRPQYLPRELPKTRRYDISVQILGVCKDIYLEALPILWGKNTVYLKSLLYWSPILLEEWLAHNISFRTSFTYIKSLRLKLFGDSELTGLNVLAEMIQQRPSSLQNLTVEIYTSKAIKPLQRLSCDLLGQDIVVESNKFRNRKPHRYIRRGVIYNMENGSLVKSTNEWYNKNFYDERYHIKSIENKAIRF
ncbi:uncharacterized protein KY384_007522 [Bacidia gigantensis]|uniref:uncharacterized protein n=1 Tax=Bacidia gigantensis TaxID=2732470 RepID=UPI001D03A46E|nr:uncharacterized protein KY384_007522 [Bacidia gigantensis]KAG8527370.1 hypothetical protein KY384_007522 [Bacidia gigantensis]